MTDSENPWTEAQTCGTLHEAQVIKALLEDAGIDVLLPDEHTLGVDPGLVPAYGGVRVLVRADELFQARAIIRAVTMSDALPDNDDEDEEDEE